MRFHVTPRDVLPAVAARRMGMTPAAFDAALPVFIARNPALVGGIDADGAVTDSEKPQRPHLR